MSLADLKKILFQNPDLLFLLASLPLRQKLCLPFRIQCFSSFCQKLFHGIHTCLLLEKTLQLYQILVEHHSSYIHFFESCCLLIKCFHYKLGQGKPLLKLRPGCHLTDQPVFLLGHSSL